MSGGKEKKQTNQMIEQSRQREEAAHKEYTTKSAAEQAAGEGRREESRGQVMSSLNYTPERVSAPSVNFGAGKSLYQPFINTGGIDENKSRVGQDVMSEYSKTGGLSEGDRTNLRARATSTIPAFYAAMQQNANRLGRVQGGYGPGQTAMAARLARESAMGTANAARGAETDIIDRVNQGRQWGAGTLSDSERAIQSMLQQGKMFGTSGWSDLDRAEQSQNASLENQANMFNSEQGQQQAQFRSGALGSLYGSDVGELEQEKQRQLEERGMFTGNMSTGINQRIGNNPYRSPWDIAGNLLGGAGGLMTGAAGFR